MSDDHPRRSLEQQKKQAKELLRALRAGDPAAHERFRRQLPDKARLTLADAQYVLAREQGFTSWAALRRAGAQRTPDDPADAFRRACHDGNASALRALLQHSAEARALVNEPLFAFDSPALAHFSGGSNLALIDVLLEFGADPNRRTDWWAGGFHPLHGASQAVAERLLAHGAVADACSAAHLDRLDLLRAILDADPARVHERGGDGQTPLHFARSRPAVDLLLERGADIDARDVDHFATPAQWMLERRRGAGRYDLARHLVERGATADIFLAAALGLTDRVRALLESDASQLELRTGQGEYDARPPASYHIYFWTIGQSLTPLRVAQQFEQHETAALMRTFATPKQRLLDACAGARSAEARALLEAQPALGQQLAPEDQRALADAAWAGDADAVALMMDLGFDPAVRGHDGGTALHCAAWTGSTDAVRAILAHARGRAIIDDRDPAYGATPLGWCLHGSVHCGRNRADHAGTAQLLLDAGAEPVPADHDVPPDVQEVLRGG